MKTFFGLEVKEKYENGEKYFDIDEPIMFDKDGVIIFWYTPEFSENDVKRYVDKIIYYIYKMKESKYVPWTCNILKINDNIFLHANKEENVVDICDNKGNVIGDIDSDSEKIIFDYLEGENSGQ